MEKYRLQKYKDGSYGYLGIDGNEECKLTTKSPVVCTQGEYEDRDEFIAKNGITFKEGQYGSNEELDREANYPTADWVRRDVAIKGYALDKLVNDASWLVRKSVAIKGYGLGRLILDESCEVRWQVAKHGYGLGILIYDKEIKIREEVARQGFGLDILINDRSECVRREVANQGYGLDVLINDESSVVRESVVRQGYGLDKLINDKSSFVRAEVARQGYGLDVLVNDEDKYVRYHARHYLDVNHITLDEWAARKAPCASEVGSLERGLYDFNGTMKQISEGSNKGLILIADKYILVSSDGWIKATPSVMKCVSNSIGWGTSIDSEISWAEYNSQDSIQVIVDRLLSDGICMLKTLGKSTLSFWVKEDFDAQGEGNDWNSKVACSPDCLRCISTGKLKLVHDSIIACLKSGYITSLDVHVRSDGMGVVIVWSAVVAESGVNATRGILTNITGEPECKEVLILNYKSDRICGMKEEKVWISPNDEEINDCIYRVLRDNGNGSAHTITKKLNSNRDGSTLKLTCFLDVNVSSESINKVIVECPY